MKEKYYGLLAEQLISRFEQRNMQGYYCRTKAEALKKALSFLSKDDLVSYGGSRTLAEIGFHDVMKSGGYRFLDPREALGGESKEELARQALAADYYFLSANAITEAGEMVNIDGIGNRLAALIYGPKHVVVIAGMNKVVANLEAAIQRVRTYAARLCLTQMNQEYASLAALSEAAAKSEGFLLITSRSVFPGRMKIILVGEDLGV